MNFSNVPMVILESIIDVALVKDIGLNIMEIITIDKTADGSYYNLNSTHHAS